MESQPKFNPNPKFKLMDQVREVLRYHHYAYRTEQTYCQWILRYIRFFGGNVHPRDLAAHHVERFLSDLVVKGEVSASTQRQALNAIVFLYREVLDLPLEGKNPTPFVPKKDLCYPLSLAKKRFRPFFSTLREPMR